MNKACMVRANQAPQDSEDNQTEHAVTRKRMPTHGITADLDSDKTQNNADYQKPVKQSNRQVPDTDGFIHILRINHYPL